MLHELNYLVFVFVGVWGLGFGDGYSAVKVEYLSAAS